MRVLRPLMLTFCAVALCLVAAAIAGAAYFAPPQPERATRAVSVSGATPFTLLLRHGLVCTDEDALTTVCRATVVEQPLTVTVVRRAPESSIPITCTASYGERTAPCRGGFPPYAVIDGGALGIDGVTVLAARPAWLLPERWYGSIWLRAFVGLAVILALGVAAVAFTAPTSHPLGRLALSTGVGVTTFIVAAPLLGLYLDSLRYLD